MTLKIFGIWATVIVFGNSLLALATEGTANGEPPRQNVNYTHLPGADQGLDGIAAPSGGSDYLFIAGSAFTPRTSAQTVSYPGGGCLYSNDAVNTSLELPDGAVVEGARLYYFSNSPTDNLELYLNRFPGNGSFSNFLSGETTYSSGYVDEYFFASPTITIDNLSGAHVLVVVMEPNTRFCGVRLFYTP